MAVTDASKGIYFSQVSCAELMVQSLDATEEAVNESAVNISLLNDSYGFLDLEDVASCPAEGKVRAATHDRSNQMTELRKRDASDKHSAEVAAATVSPVDDVCDEDKDEDFIDDASDKESAEVFAGAAAVSPIDDMDNDADHIDDASDKQSSEMAAAAATAMSPVDDAFDSNRDEDDIETDRCTINILDTPKFSIDRMSCFTTPASFVSWNLDVDDTLSLLDVDLSQDDNNVFLDDADFLTESTLKNPANECYETDAGVEEFPDGDVGSASVEKERKLRQSEKKRSRKEIRENVSRRDIDVTMSESVTAVPPSQLFYTQQSSDVSNHSQTASNDLVCQKYATCSMENAMKTDEAIMTIQHSQSPQPHTAAAVGDRERDQYSARKSLRLSRQKQVETNTAVSIVEVEINAEPQLLQTGETLSDGEKELEPKLVRRSSPGTCEQPKRQISQSVSLTSSEDSLIHDTGEWDQNFARQHLRQSQQKQVKSNAAVSLAEVETDTEILRDVDKEFEPKRARRSLGSCGQQKKQIAQMEKSVSQTSSIDSSVQDTGEWDRNLARKSLRHNPQKRLKSNAAVSLAEVEIDTETLRDVGKEFQPKPARRSLRSCGQQKKQIAQIEKSVTESSSVDVSVQDSGEWSQNLERKGLRLSGLKDVKVNAAEVETDDEPQLLQTDSETVRDVDKHLEPEPARRSSRSCGQQKKQTLQTEESDSQISNVDSSLRDTDDWAQKLARNSLRQSQQKQIKANAAVPVVEVETDAEAQLLQTDTEILRVDKEFEPKPTRRSLRRCGQQKKQIAQMEKSVSQSSNTDGSVEDTSVVMSCQHEDMTYISATEKSANEKQLKTHLVHKTSHKQQQHQSEQSQNQTTKMSVVTPDTRLYLSQFQQAVATQRSVGEATPDGDKQLKPKPVQRSLKSRRQPKKPSHELADIKRRRKLFNSNTNIMLPQQADETSKQVTADGRNSSQTADANIELFNSTENANPDGANGEDIVAVKHADKKITGSTVSPSDLCVDISSSPLNVQTTASRPQKRKSSAAGCSDHFSGVVTTGHAEISPASSMGCFYAKTMMTEPTSYSSNTTEAEQRLNKVMAIIALDQKSEDEQGDEDASNLHQYPCTNSDIHVSRHVTACQNFPQIVSDEFSHIFPPVDRLHTTQMHSSKGKLCTVSNASEYVHKMEDRVTDHSESQSLSSQQRHQQKCSVAASQYAVCSSSQDVGSGVQMQQQGVQNIQETVGYSGPEVNKIPGSTLAINSQKQAACASREDSMVSHSESSQKPAVQQRHQQKCSMADYSFGSHCAQNLCETEQQVLTAGVDYSSQEVDEIPSSLPDIYSQMHSNRKKQANNKQDSVTDHGEFSQATASQQRRQQKCSFAAYEYSVDLRASQNWHKIQDQAAGIEYSSPEVNEIPGSLPLTHSHGHCQKQTMHTSSSLAPVEIQQMAACCGQAAEAVQAEHMARSQPFLPDADAHGNRPDLPVPRLHNTDTAVYGDETEINDNSSGALDVNADEANFMRRTKVSRPQQIWMHASKRQADAHEVDDECSQQSKKPR